MTLFVVLTIISYYVIGLSVGLGIMVYSDLRDEGLLALLALAWPVTIAMFAIWWPIDKVYVIGVRLYDRRRQERLDINRALRREVPRK